VPGHQQLEARLGYAFRDPALLRCALTHPSLTHEHGPVQEHNQRLEFLGDAVLQLILTRALYDLFPGADEGSLTKARAALVNRRSLAVQARALDLGASLVLSRGEEQSGGRDRPSNLADCFEALLGAVFLDGGLEAAQAFVLRRFDPGLATADIVSAMENPKGELQELLQSDSAPAPEYRLVAASGPDHDRRFECLVVHGGRELAHGRGRSKKAAETEAAWNALRALRGTSDEGEGI
jgi:ribonuclease III